MPEAGPNPQAEAWIPVARFLRPQGRRGELLAEPLTDVPEVLAAGVTLRLAGDGSAAPSGKDDAVTIEHSWKPTGRNAGRVVLKVSGCDDIGQAEGLSGKQLMMPVGALPSLEPDQFYVRELLGCTLLNDGKPLGEVVDVQFPTTPDGARRLEDAAALLEVQLGSGGDTLLVPFVRAWLVRVDQAGRRIEMRLPRGLADVEDAENVSESV